MNNQAFIIHTTEIKTSALGIETKPLGHNCIMLCTRSPTCRASSESRGCDRGQSEVSSRIYNALILLVWGYLFASRPHFYLCAPHNALSVIKFHFTLQCYGPG